MVIEICYSTVLKQGIVCYSALLFIRTIAKGELGATGNQELPITVQPAKENITEEQIP